MKTIVKNYPALVRLKKQVLLLWDKPSVKELVRYAGIFLSSLLLSGVSAAGSSLPLAACACCVGALFPRKTVILLGCICGYLLRFGSIGAVEPIGITVLIFAGAALFRDTRYPAAPWFFSFLCCSVTAAVGFAFLLYMGISVRSVSLYITKVFLAFACPLLYRQADGQKLRGARLLCLLLVFTGLSSALPPFGFYAGVAIGFAVAVSSQATGLLPTVLCGIGLDLSFRFGGSVTACLCAGALLGKLLCEPSALLRSLLFWAVCISWQLLFGIVSLPFALCAAAGCAIGLVIPVRWFEVQPQSSPKLPKSDNRLHLVSQVFAQLHRGLSFRSALPPADISEVYDSTSEKVCRCCVRSHACWEEEAALTYRELCAAAVPIVSRGSALREDFSPAFAERCRHMEGFLTALNQELEVGLSRRRMHNRLQEGRLILSGQYLFLSRFLEGLSRQSVSRAHSPLVFVPEHGVSACPQPGNSVCGDSTLCLQDEWGHYYVLLCDGMGTGTEAAQESNRAIHMLCGLLEAGVAPDTALEILNGFYVLLETTRFATVDLLQADLRTGSAVLFKWGAAPSYLYTDGSWKKIGTASVPPGLRVDSEHAAAQYRLSLSKGESLVLLSDGIVGEETEKQLNQLPASTCQELAESLITGIPAEHPDDRTVVVVRLKPSPSA